jgi:PAS domain S-box-containing protein
MISALIASLVALLRALVYKPVRDLRDAMDMAQASVDEPQLPILGHDELADLKRGFVSMLGRLEGLHRTNLEKEKELARNQETMRFRAELQAMFDAMQDGVLLVDRDLRIVQSNPRAYALLPGLTAAAGKISAERSREDSCPHHGVQKVLETGEMCEHQCSFKLPGGEERHLHSICAPVEENGIILYVVEVLRDITERVRTDMT